MIFVVDDDDDPFCNQSLKSFVLFLDLYLDSALMNSKIVLMVKTMKVYIVNLR